MDYQEREYEVNVTVKVTQKYLRTLKIKIGFKYIGLQMKTFMSPLNDLNVADLI